MIPISDYKAMYKNKKGAFYKCLRETENEIKEIECAIMSDNDGPFSLGEYQCLKEDLRKLRLILYYNMTFEERFDYRRKIKLEKQELHFKSHGNIDSDKEYYKEFYDSDCSDDEWDYDDHTLTNNINKYNGH